MQTAASGTLTAGRGRGRFNQPALWTQTNALNLHAGALISPASGLPRPINTQKIFRPLCGRQAAGIFTARPAAVFLYLNGCARLAAGNLILEIF